MIIDCISDLHGHYPKLEVGDLLIVAGDLTAKDTLFEHADFTYWLAKQKYKMKIVIGGNHDGCIYQEIIDGIGGRQKRYDNFHGDAIYLEDTGTEFEGLKIWGSPWTKTFPGMNPQCKAFTCNTEEELAKKWALIPDDTDILVTHGPMRSILDKTVTGESIGSLELMCASARKTNLKLHVFGHVHESYGQFRDGPLLHLNASHVNQRYEPVNQPIRIEL